MPKFSIITPSYNHEKYVKHFLESILNQTFKDFELIIIDDFSKDNTVKEIEKFSDSRIKFFKNNFNMGINATFNKAFSKAQGEYCVFIASDDMLENIYLETVLNHIKKNPNAGVFYCSHRAIDENNNLLNKIFCPEIKEKYELLNHLFLHGNCLSSPGMAIKREACEKIMPLENSMCQNQDYKMNIALLLNEEIEIIETPIVKYRMPSNTSGISHNTKIVKTRRELEESKTMDAFLEIKDTETINKIFKTKAEAFKNADNKLIPYILGKLALESSTKEKRIWGYQTIMNFVNNDENYNLLNSLYGFSFKEYINLAQAVMQSPDTIKKEQKYKKYRKLSITFGILFGICTLMFLVVLLTSFIR